MNEMNETELQQQQHSRRIHRMTLVFIFWLLAGFAAAVATRNPICLLCGAILAGITIAVFSPALRKHLRTLGK